MISKIKILGLTALTTLTLSACGGGSSSSDTEANVTQECTNQVGIRLFNSCDFNVNSRVVRGNVINDSSNVAPGQDFTDLLPGETLSSLQYVLCRAPSRPNGDATGCS